MKLSSLELANFRKFRAATALTGLDDGLNILVEPNEAGKSTLLEALRAAFFIRHSAKSELVRSFCPFGDDVAPKVAVSFDLGADNWRLEKQFLKAPHILLSGPDGRFESDAAEERLQALLGFEKGNNRGSDPETRGALGLLWVEQAGSLHVAPPGQLVRDSVRSALEAEIGTVLGGRRFEQVKARVEDAFITLRTARSEKATGRLADAETALARARAAREKAETDYRTYEQTLGALEEARTARRLIERDLTDPEQAERKTQFEADLKIAETAQFRLVAAQARHAESAGLLREQEHALARLEQAEADNVAAGEALATARAKAAESQAACENATAREAKARGALGEARVARGAAERAIADAHVLATEHRRHEALAQARARLAEARQIEQDIEIRRAAAAQAIDPGVLKVLASLDKRATETRALFEAGAVIVAIEPLSDIAVQVDGAPSSAAKLDVVAPTEILIDKIARLTITPPMAGGRSAQTAAIAAAEALADQLLQIGATSYAEAIGRDRMAQSAVEAVATLEQRLSSLCIADPALGLAAGYPALKLFVDGAAETAREPAAAAIDLATLNAALDTARETEQAMATSHELAQKDLHDAEKASLLLQAATVTAERDAQAAEALVEALNSAQPRDATEKALAATREELGRRADALQEARQAAEGFDADRIKRAIANIDQAHRTALEQKQQLGERIAMLGATVENEGPKGLPGVLAEAIDLEEAARTHHAQLVAEADALALLRTTLREAGEEASRTFLGPITRRAARYIDRVLPGSDLHFGEEMGLNAIERHGIQEQCCDLSQGTQEQLAVLTRVALADLLRDKGAPVSLVLDDPLVYSDDGRLDAMTEILEEVAQRMQVIVLTCRAKAFRHLTAKRILITSAS